MWYVLLFDKIVSFKDSKESKTLMRFPELNQQKVQHSRSITFLSSYSSTHCAYKVS